MVPPMEKSETGTLKEMPTSQTKPSSGNRRRGPLRSRTVDTLLHILSLCYADSSHIKQDSDNGGTHMGSVAKDDALVTHTDTIPNDSLCQVEMSVDETRVVLSTQEGGLYNKHVESAECDHNISEERKDLSDKVDTTPSNSFDIKNQDNYDIVSSTLRTGDQQIIPMTPISVTDVMISSPHLTTEKDVEEGEVSGEFMDFMAEDDKSSVDRTGSEPEDFIGIEPVIENANNSIPLSTHPVDDVGKDMVAIAVTAKRNLVDYSEIAVHGKSIQTVKAERFHGRLETRESAKQGNAAIESDCVPLCPEHVLPPRSNLKNSATKNQNCVSPVKDSGVQNNKKRQGSPTEEKRTNKKAKKSVDPTTCSENRTMLGEHPEDASQEVVDASASKQDAANEKKKKRVLTKERKAKKKRKERIKRAEKNRKLGVKRLKLQPVMKEKKITYCRHYLKGRCHEGEKCKFSHDTIPLTKSKPCCHFARHSCMKGDDCPFDHQLSKYPCNNHLSKGFCSRGSDCMFSHEAQSIEASLNASNELKPEQSPSSFLDNSGSKKHNNFDGSSRENVVPKSCSIPMSVPSNAVQNLVETTPKLSARPPKGISFLSQGKLPLETRSSPNVDAEVKGCEIIHSAPSVVQDSTEITKTPPVVPRGINFLSFGKRPGLDHSDGGFFFKTGNGIGKSQLSNLEGQGSKSDSTIDVDDGVKNDTQIGNNGKQMKYDLLTDGQNSSLKRIPMLPFMSSSLPKALRSTLAFASKFESGVKTRRPRNFSEV